MRKSCGADLGLLSLDGSKGVAGWGRAGTGGRYEIIAMVTPLKGTVSLIATRPWRRSEHCVHFTNEEGKGQREWTSMA